MMLKRKLLARSIERLLLYKIICKNWTTGQGEHWQTKLMPTKFNLFTFSSFLIQAIYEIFKSASSASLWTWPNHTGPYWQHLAEVEQLLNSLKAADSLPGPVLFPNLSRFWRLWPWYQEDGAKVTVHRYISIKEWHWLQAAHGCNPRTQEAKAVGFWIRSQSGIHRKTLSQTNKMCSFCKVGRGTRAWLLTYWGMKNWKESRLVVWD